MGFQTLVLLLLCLFTLQCSMQNIYFVVPTPSAPCPIEACLTLSQYVEEIDRYFTSNTTLMFSPGRHTLEANVSIENVTGLVLLGSSSASSQTTSSIVCRGSAAFEFFQTENLRISSLAFNSCGNGDATSAVSITSASDAEVSNCVFGNSTSQNGNGGGLALEDSNVILTENVFEYNSAYFGGAVYVSNSIVTFTRNNFSRNSALQGGAVSIVSSRVNFFGNSFIANSAFAIGGGVSIQNSVVIFTENIFAGNIADSVGGGAVLFDSSIGNFTEDKFQNNLAYCAGAGVYVFESTAEFHQSYFTANDALDEGGGLYVADGTIKLYGNTFANNTAGSSGGGIRVTSFSVMGKSIVTLNENVLMNNSASYGGGAMNIDNCNANFSENVFVYNNAGNVGGGFFLEDSVVNFYENTLTNNIAGSDSGGCGYIHSSAVEFSGNVFVGCSAGNEGGALRVASSTLSFAGDRFCGNTANLGGAVFMHANSNVSFSNSTAESNSADYGGSVTAFDSSVKFTGETNFSRNSANYGGGLYLTNANLQIGGKCNFIDNWSTYGGGFYASRSNVHFRGNTNFTGNSAFEGGGFLLTVDSVTHLFANTSISLTNNRAEESGGAIRVEDSNPLTYCFETLQYRSECFFQLEGNFTFSEVLDIASSITVHFANNSARSAGGDLYGGAVESCVISRYAISGGEIFSSFISDERTQVNISSDPLRICHCNASTGEIDCSDSIRSVHAFPGGTVEISAVALGQTDGPVPAVVHASLSENRITLQDLERTQTTNNTCSSLRYNIYSSLTNVSEVMTLSADGPCPPSGRSLSVYVEVLKCPHGFELSNISHSCVCHERLRKFTDNCVVDDGSKTGTIFRRQNADFWVGFDPRSQGLILHPNCPFDFCATEQMFIAVDDSDAQCNYNRNGLLCGGCPDGLSLVLGSSQCLQCSNNYLALLLVFAFAGIVLVVFMFILKLTVAAGTISGLIFYANLIQVNSTVFFPAGTTNFLTVFIAWLNLDFGIHTCFYDGMDAYSKIWLQFVFPIYIWSLVGLIILVSHYSVRIANMIGSCNPIPILATLFFISYAKILRTIIAALSVTSLEYADGSDPVWAYDGNIRYLKGKHIPLFLIALFCLLFLFLPYTLFLFLGQWLPRMKWKVFSWINRPKVRSFLDAHHAPYVPQHRYWTGLLLLVRCILFLIIAVYGRGIAVSLLVVTIAALTLVTTSLLTGGVYKSRLVGAVEAFFILNLGVLAVGTFYVQLTGGSQTAVASTSVSIAFLMFAGVVSYHSYLLYVQGTKLLGRLPDLSKWYRCFGKEKKSGTVDSIEPVREDSNDRPVGTSTTSWIEFREPMLESM